MALLVCGGAGYIGSHTVALLVERGVEVVVVDNLQKGHKAAVPANVAIHTCDLRDPVSLEQVFTQHAIDAVIDFAADSLVGESVSEPLKYYHNNVYGTLCLLETMKKHNVKNIVFSSTAATYGEPESTPIYENAVTKPTSPYGETKLVVENMLRWADQAHGIQYVVLRYFNAAGAHESGEIGEDHTPESHLIPIVLQAALGKREEVSIYGNDYPTRDGTCVRDYIHVTDLAEAHILAVESLLAGGKSAIYNLGNGQGFTVQEVIETARKVTGIDIAATMADRRSGDPAVLIASSEKIISELGWKPQLDSLETIIASAWKWHKNHPDGYGA